MKKIILLSLLWINFLTAGNFSLIWEQDYVLNERNTIVRIEIFPSYIHVVYSTPYNKPEEGAAGLYGYPYYKASIFDRLSGEFLDNAYAFMKPLAEQKYKGETTLAVFKKYKSGSIYTIKKSFENDAQNQSIIIDMQALNYPENVKQASVFEDERIKVLISDCIIQVLDYDSELLDTIECDQEPDWVLFFHKKLIVLTKNKIQSYEYKLTKTARVCVSPTDDCSSE